MNNLKRQRVDPSNDGTSSSVNCNDVGTEVDNDCYKEVMYGSSRGYDPVRTSWINTMQWISGRSSCASSDAVSAVSDVSMMITTEQSWTCTSDKLRDMQEDLKHTATQLGLVKRRFTHATTERREHQKKQQKEQNVNSNRDTRSNHEKMNNASSSWDSNKQYEFESARRECNPFEVLGEWRNGGMNTLFMNRSAIKLANIDAALGFCLTERTTYNNDDDGGVGNGNGNGNGPTISSPFDFVDLCAAPGGFSEYLLYRCHSNCIPVIHGYAMSLVGSNEQGCGTKWKLQDRKSDMNGSTSFYRICHGADGTGDIYKWENIEYLKRFIYSYHSSEVLHDKLDSSNERVGMVHLVVADGGFDAQRNVEEQEQMSQKLIVCETAAALLLLRKGGMFVIKMFGFQTPVVRAVMTYLYWSFQKVIAIKPISSRPASAERYVCCSGFLGNPSGWDGKVWSTMMFMGRMFDQNLTISHEIAFQTNDCNEGTLYRLYYYLDKFDRDMYNLNLKACFAILTTLQQQQLHQNINIQQQQQYMNSDTDEDEMNDYQVRRTTPASTINIAEYKQKWRLVE